MHYCCTRTDLLIIVRSLLVNSTIIYGVTFNQNNDTPTEVTKESAERG